MRFKTIRAGGCTPADSAIVNEVNQTSFKAIRAKATSSQIAKAGAMGTFEEKRLLPQLLNENIRAVAAACRAAATLTFPCADRTAASASTRRAPQR
jgi:hypothetical protein